MKKEMPKLEAGMIIKTRFDGVDAWFLYINDNALMELGEKANWELMRCVKTSDSYEGILEIYSPSKSMAFHKYLEDKVLIWEKRSDNQIKIEELEETVKKSFITNRGT
jgi:hypothetical protein